MTERTETVKKFWGHRLAFTEQKNEMIRKELLDEALRCAVTIGMRKTSVEQLTEAVGVNNAAFQKGDATKLPFPDETFDAVTGNYVYHNIAGVNKQQLLLETLRTLKKGGTFAIHDLMSKNRYGDMVVYEPNMGDYLLCHAAFVLPATFACYKANGDLKKLKGNTAYLNRLIDAGIEGYRAIQNSGHEILPKADKDFESAAYRKTCMRFFKLMCATSLGKICVSDHAMNAVDEMNALNRDIKKFFESTGAEYPTWQAPEQECGQYFGT